MKLLSLALGLVMLVSVQGAQAAVKKSKPRAFAACQTNYIVPSNGLIYKNSAPVRAGKAHSSPIVYFRNQPTLIIGKPIAAKVTSTVFDSAGNIIGRCPFTSADGAYGRLRCTMESSSLRSTAVKNTGSPTVFFKLKGSTCAKVLHAGKCYGSVKGNCNRIF